MPLKTFSFFLFLFLVTPGSGRLAWNGFPLSNKAEFATLTLLVIVVFSQQFRGYLRQLMERHTWSRLTVPVLIILCSVKFLTFAWAPIGDGFQSCYRSIYYPLPEVAACEKSYEGPWLREGNLPTRNISRIDSTIDFGKRPYDWSLPFMNDLRLDIPWLQRFPFESKHFGLLESGSNNSAYLPVYAIGDLTVSVNDRIISSSTNYDRPYLSVIPLSRQATSKLLVEFRYQEEERTIPKSEPEPRGQYAALKIGVPQSADYLLEASQLVVIGRGPASTESLQLNNIVVRDRNGRVIDYLDNKAERASELDSKREVLGLDIALPGESLLMSPLSLSANYRGDLVTLATIKSDPGNPFSLTLDQKPDLGIPIALTALFSIDRNDVPALEPSAPGNASIGLRLLQLLIDLVSLLISLFLGFVILRVMRLDVLLSTVVALASWLTVGPVFRLVPTVLGGGRELVVPYAMLSLLVLVIYRSILRYPLAFMAPSAIVLASHKVFEEMQFNHPGESDAWWGKLLYHWRGSDWLVAQGFGRMIFTESSLQGGESVYWFQSGPRYLAVFLRVLLGENDILIGVAFVTFGYLIAWVLASRFLETNENKLGRFMAVGFLFILQIFLGDQLIITFGFVNSSEYPTWLAILGVTAFLLSDKREPRIWYTTALAAALASLPHFRPNLLFVCLGLLFLVIMRSQAEPRLSAVRQVVFAAAAAIIVLPLSLVHNLYYGNTFVPFAGNANINYAFNWTEIFQGSIREGLMPIWQQLRGLMYWRVPHDPNFAIFFWGAQLSLLLALILRVRKRVVRSSRSLLLFLPLLYVLPMLKFQLGSYYPRHLVAASLLCLCSAMLAWPRPTISKKLSQ